MKNYLDLKIGQELFYDEIKPAVYLTEKNHFTKRLGYVLGHAETDDTREKTCLAVLNIGPSYINETEYLVQLANLCNGEKTRRMLMTTNVLTYFLYSRELFEELLLKDKKYRFRAFKMLDNDHFMVTSFEEKIPMTDGLDDDGQFGNVRLYYAMVYLVDNYGNILETTCPETLKMTTLWENEIPPMHNQEIKRAYYPQRKRDKVYFAETERSKKDYVAGVVIGRVKTIDCGECQLILEGASHQVWKPEKMAQEAVLWHQSYRHGRKDIFMTEDVLRYLYQNQEKFADYTELYGKRCAVTKIIRPRAEDVKSGRVLECDCGCMLSIFSFPNGRYDSEYWAEYLLLADDDGNILRTEYPLDIELM